jgi:hypothetical protein
LGGRRCPKNTPREIVEELNKQAKTALAHPNIKARFAALGVTVFPAIPPVRKIHCRKNREQSKVILTANIKSKELRCQTHIPAVSILGNRARELD